MSHVYSIGSNERATVDIYTVTRFLKQNHFYVYREKDYDRSNSPLIIKLERNVLYRYDLQAIKQYLVSEGLKHLQDGTEKENVDRLLRGFLKGLKMTDLQTLPEFTNDMHRDPADAIYFFFPNMSIKVNSDGITRDPEFNGFIWNDQIISRDLSLKSWKDIEQNGDFFKFLCRITDHEDPEISKKRFQFCMRIIGYLLHTYKFKSKAKAVLISDEEEGEGGTGKSLLALSLREMRSLAIEDGRHFDSANRFAFSQVMPAIQILYLEDISRDFKFEPFYNIITGDMVVERKYVDRLTVPFKDSPKIVVTTNFIPAQQGNSWRRRIIEFCLTKHYDDGEGITPVSEFGHEFFTEWDQDQWDYFYSLYIYASQYYLREGIPEEEDPLVTERWRRRFDSGLLDFFEQHLGTKIKLDKGKLFGQYQNGHAGPVIDQNSFTRQMKKYAEFKKWKVTESHSGNISYILFSERDGES